MHDYGSQDEFAAPPQARRIPAAHQDQGVGALLGLQRAVGNAGVARMLAAAARSGQASVPGGGTVDDGARGGPPAAPMQEVHVQRVVRQRRGCDKWHSTLVPGREFDRREDAEAADLAEQQRLEAELAERVAARRRPPAVAAAAGERPDPGTVAHSSLALAMAQHPAHFGPLMTRGGDVTTAAVSAAVGGAAVAPARGPDDPFDHSGKNTYAAILTDFQVAGESVDVRAYSRTGGHVAVSNLDTEYPPATHAAQFRDEYLFQQGPPPDGVELPAGRREAHAEINALHSRGMPAAFHQASRGMSMLVEQLGGLPADIAAGDYQPTDADLSQMAMVLGADPVVNVTVAENRAPCGIHGKSGYRGGCTQELADAADTLHAHHVAAAGAPAADQQRALGLVRPTVSVAGPYRQQGAAGIMAGAGFTLDVHNTYGYMRGTGLEPLDPAQQELAARYRALEPQPMDAPEWTDE